ncbi:MAG TPA: hypothetical protein VIC27_03185, partial [Ktedonobacterales bacterium]
GRPVVALAPFPPTAAGWRLRPRLWGQTARKARLRGPGHGRCAEEGVQQHQPPDDAWSTVAPSCGENLMDHIIAS